MQIIKFKNLYAIFGKLTQLKNWEFQIFYNLGINLSTDFSFQILQKYSNNYYCIHINIFNLITFYNGWTKEQDHAGFGIELGILGLNIQYNIYDIRHWNDEINNYEE